MRYAGGWSIVVGLLLQLVGCAPARTSEPRDLLMQASAALETRRYGDAIGLADAYLSAYPAGSGAAEALYIRGRAFEDMPVVSEGNAHSNMLAARRAYVDALDRNPDRTLAGYLHASIADVAYWQDDYVSAVRHGRLALPLLTTDEQRSWTLYRTGVAEQRLGQFDAADRTFAEVQSRFPSTEAAERARNRSGKRAFFVQLATYANGQLADALVAQLVKEGQSPRRVVDAKGHHVVSIGPFGNFDSARQARQRLSARFPDALIVP